MRGTRFFVSLFVFLGVVSLASGQSLVTVYSEDFDDPVGPEWSRTTRTTDPNLTRTFLGEFWGQGVTLDLWDLPEHCSVTISFDLIIINSWEGSVGWNAGSILQTGQSSLHAWHE